MASRSNLRVVIIGGVATGPKAAARARRLAPEAEIAIVEQGDTISYAGCGLPFYVAGLVPDLRALLSTQAGTLRDSAYFGLEKDIKVLTRTRAEEIDRANKEVVALNLDSGRRDRLGYDKLVISTGSIPVTPPVAGMNLNGVFRLAHPRDAVALREAVRDASKTRAVVVGAGLVGLEAADALVNRDKEVAIVEMADQVLPGLLDWEMAALVARHLTRQGVEVRTSHKLTGLQGDDQGNLVTVDTERGSLEANVAVVAIGVRPNVGLAQEAGLAIGETGAIAVDECLRTSDPDIYAGGDCVESVHLVSGRRVYAPMGSTANKHGRVIGDNVVGGQEVFRGILGTAVLQVLDFNVGRTGLTEGEARRIGHPVVTATVAGFDCAHYYPAHASMVLKVVVDADSGRLLGAQGVGAGEVAKRIDVLAAAISLGGDLESLAKLDLGYAPPFASAVDIAAHAANVARNKLSGLAKGVTAAEVKAKLDRGDDFILLDVRTPKEVQSERFRSEHVLGIPLGELRGRLDELPKDKEIVVFCQMGTRSYEAQVLLEGQGFSKVRFLDGGLLAWPFENR